MDNERSKTISIIFALLFIIILTIILILARGKRTIEPYLDNQIIHKKVLDKDIAQIYFNDFMEMTIIDRTEAYNMLDDNYKNKLGSFENFEELLNQYEENDYYNVKLKSFRVINKNGYKYYYIIDNNDRVYVFKEKSIMNYTVYLDEKSVEI